jgi:hypothetical protein
MPASNTAVVKRLQDPQSVRAVLRQQWLPSAAVLCLLCALATWKIHEHLPQMLYALPLGLLVAGAIWSAFVLLAARGWIAFIFDD